MIKTQRHPLFLFLLFALTWQTVQAVLPGMDNPGETLSLVGADAKAGQSSRG